MSDELDDLKDDVSEDEVDEKELGDIADLSGDDIDPEKITTDDLDDPIEDAAEVVSPEEDPFGFGAFGELDEDGEYVSPTETDDDDEGEEEVDENLF